MKIVSVLTTASDGGAEFAAIQMLDALAGRGHATVLLTNRPGIVRDTRVREVPIALGPKLSAQTWPSLVLGAPALFRRLLRALEHEAPYDVLLVHFKKEQLLGAALPDRLRPVLAWAEWGPVPAVLRRGLPGRLYAAAGARVGAVLAISEETRRTVVAAGLPADRVEVVNNVVFADQVRFDPQARARVRAELGVADPAFVVGCISRFNTKKRNDVAVAAALALARDDGGVPPVHLVMAGDGETESALRAQAAPLGDRAHFLPTPGDGVPELLSACDATVFCPSPTEGAPRAIILAMLTERPCVATGPEGARALLVPGTGAIAEPVNDPAVVADLLRGYRDDPGRAHEEGIAARRRAAELHDADAIAARIEALFLAARG
jgi:glycosyltransferase involved in cell wall biosynthesis